MMKTMKPGARASALGSTAAVMMALAAAAPAAAQGWYLGADLAHARLGTAQPGWFVETWRADARDSGGALFAGYRLDARWAVELGARRLGEAEWFGQPPFYCPPGLICLQVMPPLQTVRVRSHLLQASAIVSQPVGQGWTLRGRAGLAQWRGVERHDTNMQIMEAGQPLRWTSTPMGATRRTRVVPWLGVGARYAVADRLGLVAELQTAGGPRADRPTLVSLGAEFSF